MGLRRGQIVSFGFTESHHSISKCCDYEVKGDNVQKNLMGAAMTEIVADPQRGGAQKGVPFGLTCLGERL
jgi:hypothetical protein